MNYIKNMGKRLSLYLYSILLVLTAFYSYALVDPNFTLLNNQLWEVFRNAMVQLGYYQRPLSSLIYILIVGLLFGFHFYFLKNYKKVDLKFILIVLFFVAVASYPFLSHDFFNYMFDAKIFSVYQKNPYLYKALDFPQDDWLRFMHWTHRTYPYGPTFLPITLIPSFLAMGKLFLNFIFFKATFFLFFWLGVYSLSKIDKKYAVFFATNPYVIVEGLVNAHNDLVALSLVLFGIYLMNKERVWSRVMLLVSAGIKYVSVPFIFITKDKKSLLFKAVFIAQILLLIYLSFSQEIQQWYFLILIGFLPFLEKFVYRLNIFFAGLLLSYYPFVAGGDWSATNLAVKHNIILAAAVLFLLSYFIKLRKR